MPGELGAALVVDDDEDVLTALACLLRRAGVTVFTARCAEEAVAMLEAHAANIAVIVSDHEMPGTDGTELSRTVRDRWPGISRVMLTGNADLHQLLEAIAHCATTVSCRRCWTRPQPRFGTARPLAPRSPPASYQTCWPHGPRASWRCCNFSAKVGPIVRSGRRCISVQPP